ncbi:hypothetical protein [Frankia tisae]|uniref:hypothetical protein n=1 Tax=Frankia tisae TaxID=2950104 RepID=UPI0021C00841|nr:hypothetical protein [Frankia tisae]
MTGSTPPVGPPPPPPGPPAPAAAPPALGDSRDGDDPGGVFTHAGRRAAIASVTVAAVLLVYYGLPLCGAAQGMALAAGIVIISIGRTARG